MHIQETSTLPALSGLLPPLAPAGAPGLNIPTPCPGTVGRRLDAIFREMEACVRDPGVQTPALSAEIREACRAAVNDAFALTSPAHPAVAELRRLALGRLEAAMLREDACADDVSPLQAAVPAPDPEDQEGRHFREEYLRRAVDLTDPPPAYLHCTAELDNPRSGPGRLAEVIDQDPGLAAALLALANSRAYALPSAQHSTQRAVIFLGYRELRALILGLATLRRFRDQLGPDPGLTPLWRRSLACGYLARFLAARLGLRGGRYVTAGLLHQAGRLLAAQALPRHAAQAAFLARSAYLPDSQAERDVLGLDSPTLGGHLLARWQLPEPLAELVALRDQPLLAEDRRSAALLHVAAVAAGALEAGTPGSGRVQPLDSQAWTESGLSLADLSEAFVAAAGEIGSITQTFLKA